HVLDASRSVGVVDRLMSDELRPTIVKENRELQERLVKSYEDRQMMLVTYEEALKNRFPTNWSEVRIDKPGFTGARVVEDQSLQELLPYIDWSPFFSSWDLHGKYPKILEDEVVGAQAIELFRDAQRLLRKIVNEGLIKARGVYGFWPANSVGDDVIVYADEQRSRELCRFYMLRQQWQRAGQTQFRSLADYIAPLDSGRIDYLGAFAVSAGFGCDELAKKYDKSHDDYNSIMTKALADRLAEAFAEFLHFRARCDWGYGKEEGLSTDDLIAERYRGIRPAAGYPACPDHTEKGTLWQLLDAERTTGIKLTESFAMWPGASVSGLYFAHPESRYFAINKIGRDQLEIYAARKELPLEKIERWLAPVL
ncbi:MAG: vitamin B12 dependent-methionine synthase activation domain-containing protein, partial [Planctomycetota bacterium]